jgi:hypothetical protein
MQTQVVQFSAASFPAGFCGSPQEWFSLFTTLLSGSVLTSAYNLGSDTPTPDNQDKPWFKTDAAGRPERWYLYVDGAWIARHPVAAGSIVMYEGAEASIPTFDGGEAGTVTATTGPMWEKVAQLDGKFPLGPGTLPMSGTAVAVTNTGGAEKHALVESELPKIAIQSRQRTDLQDGGGSAALLNHATFGTQVTVDEFGGDSTGATVAHNNMPPYYAVFFLRKTARTHYRV